jgi:hypothetical protein
LLLTAAVVSTVPLPFLLRHAAIHRRWLRGVARRAATTPSTAARRSLLIEIRNRIPRPIGSQRHLLGLALIG